MPPPAAASQPPVISKPPTVSSSAGKYTTEVIGLLKSATFVTLSEDDKREKIGEEIYSYVLEKAGEESAPKITGMIIDLPFDDLMSSCQTYEGLQDKIQEGLELLHEDS